MYAANQNQEKKMYAAFFAKDSTYSVILEFMI